MDRYDRAMLKLDALAQGRYESPTTYGKRVWKLFLQVDEDEESGSSGSLSMESRMRSFGKYYERNETAIRQWVWVSQ